ncbi:MAG: general stress protein [Chloroflexota bacterium]
MGTNINVNTPGGTMQDRDMIGRRAVAGLFRERGDAERAINDLKDAGFRPDDVGVAMRDRNAQGELVQETGTKAAEGAVSGAVGGGLLGGVVGWLVGIGALAIPGIGPVVAGGALATSFGIAGGTAVAGAGIGAAAGGLVGALVGIGIPEEEARYFEQGFREGGVLVTVRADGRASDALAILERNHADTGPSATTQAGTRTTTGTTRTA